MNPPPVLTVRDAIGSDAPIVAALIGNAFHPLDVCQWLVPDPDERAAILPHNFRIFVDHALTHGTVQTTADLAGAAVWLPVPHPDITDYDDKVTATCHQWADRFRHLDDAMDRAHPVDRDHHYLAFLAVRPDRQGHGYGTALLRHHLSELDREGTPAYLVASNSRSRRLYARHGFIDSAPVLDLPYQGEPMYPMWRDPNTAPIA
ncbi:Acetyltransferase (GNAT) family protein [Micromonospora pattaloongensis]|uniref:Acetyltransferase (GNAT) family protein n=1 Tax=Micromonospora pattaloongensis TaxID=405436 RepID=A0A1H3JQH5_9ACTN|nr:GNAT family N-acetyltransferase [Micromonospora pattaloongensis]SDY41534.1 Acetyltransferase (GNAT) family protein [Micromonospora pattaloongensis]